MRRRSPDPGFPWCLLGAALSACVFAGPVHGRDAAPEIPRDSTARPVEVENLPTTPEIRDPVFSVLLALVNEDYTGTVKGEHLKREVKRSGRTTRMPVNYLREIRRTVTEGDPRAEVALVSKKGLDLAIPYKILAYHPGRVRVSAVVELDEWNLGTIRIDANQDEPAVVLEDVHLWGLKRGTVELDVDGWLDRMLGPKLDDTRVLGFALFRHEGEWIGLAMGYNRWGKGRSGSFSFRGDKILFPNPGHFKAAGTFLRGRLERLMPPPAGPSRRSRG